MPVLPPTEELTCASKRRRHLHEIDAAPHARRGKAGEIADHAAAERDDEIAALDAGGDDRLADDLEGREALGALARRHHDRGTVDAGGFQAPPRAAGR